MPEFILDKGSAESAMRFNALSGFTRGYIEAMFFTNCQYAEDGDLEGATVAELAPAALAKIEEECNAFNLRADGWLHSAYVTPIKVRGKFEDYTMEQAGRDFWFTRNGHGTGFWDRGLGIAGDKLSEIAERFGTCDPYRGDDGLVYVG